MSQHDYTIANQGFPATRADINNALSAIATNNSGTTAPSTQYAGQFWIDTTTATWTLYIHDGADDIQFATIDTSANTVNFIDSELGDNSVTTAKIADANVTSAKLSYPLTTFSSTGIDDNATSTAITIDSSENVGIGTSSPGRTLDVNGIIRSDGTSGGLAFGGNSSTPSEGSAIHRPASDTLAFVTTSSERMRIDSSGNVGIGTSSPTEKLDIYRSGSGITTRFGKDSIFGELRVGGDSVGFTGTRTAGASDNAISGYFINNDINSGTSRFEYLTLKTVNTERMRIDSSGNVDIANGIIHGGGGGISMSTSRLLPTDSTGTTNDNVNDCGGPSNRWDDIYATSGTVNTSDQNEKQSIQSLTTAEMNVAKRLSSLIKTFKWNSSVKEKGDSARTHAGIIAQDVEQAFADEGLDASNYGLWCSDTWWEKEISVDAVQAVQAQEATYDEEGNELTPAIEAVEAKDAYTYIDTKEEATEGYTEKTRLGVRYSELLSFIQAYNDQRFTELEARITALENA